MIYFNNRYYLVYRKDTTRFNKCDTNRTHDRNDSGSYIFFRRSAPVNSTGNILWEAREDSVDYIGSCNSLFDYPYYRDNLHPALTLRSSGDTVVATIVWTAHVRDTSFAGGDTVHREVLARDIRIVGTNRSMGSIQVVGYYKKTNPSAAACADTLNTWGTPVVCRLDKGYVFVFSDAVSGIIARVRAFNQSAIWPMTGAYSALDTISRRWDASVPGSIGRGLYPSVPSFAHIGAHDSTCGIIWQQPLKYVPPYFAPSTITYDIPYVRLTEHLSAGVPSITTTGTTGSPFAHGTSVSNDGGGVYRFPCLDQTQDIYDRIQEVAVWEENSFQWNRGGAYSESRIRIRSIYTDRTTLLTYLWGTMSYKTGWRTGYPSRVPLYPSVASLNDLTGVSYSDTIKAFFSIAYTPSDAEREYMDQARYRYTETLWENATRRYSYGGAHPNASTSAERQVSREGVVYEEVDEDGAPQLLRATRQFFPRSRPLGYFAQGLRASAIIDDSTECLFNASIFDPWIATDSSSLPLKLTAVSTTETDPKLDSLAQVGLVLRTENFQAHDSVRIGFETMAQLQGNIIAGDSARVKLITELVDSASGSVVMQFDSTWVTVGTPSYYRGSEGESSFTVDLLSGTYYIRMRLDTVNIPTLSYNPYSMNRYPLLKILGYVDSEEGFGKLRREGGTGESKARISAQPNPFSGSTEIRFSTPRGANVSLRVFDQSGRRVGEPLSPGWIEAGRYAIDFDATELTAGTYIVELMIDRERVVSKLIVVR